MMLAAALIIAAPAVAGEVRVIDVGGPVTELRQVGDAVYVRTDGWRQVAACAERVVCTQAGRPPTRAVAADGIPHGWVTDATPGGDVARAWYTRPTDRYGHGVLGDRIEGGAFAILEPTGRRDELKLGEGFVFEDLSPRLADLDRNGRIEIVTIRSDVRRGAAIAVYGRRDGGLAEIAAIPPIGRANRWLNVAGIADYTGDGRPDIAIVKTPHIGGTLEVWTLRGGSLTRVARDGGYSNHAIGATELGLSATADVNGDGVVDLAVPDAARRSLIVVTMHAGGGSGGVRELDRTALPAGVETAIGVLTTPDGTVFVTGLADGSLAVVRP